MVPWFWDTNMPMGAVVWAAAIKGNAMRRVSIIFRMLICFFLLICGYYADYLVCKDTYFFLIEKKNMNA